MSGSPGSSVLRPGPENRRHSVDLDHVVSHSDGCHVWGECTGFNPGPSHFSSHIWRQVSLCPLYRGGNRPNCGGWDLNEIRAQETGNHLIPRSKLSSEVFLDPRGCMTLTCSSFPSSFGPPLLSLWLTVTGPKAISPRETPIARRPERCVPHPRRKDGGQASPPSSHGLPWEAVPPMSSLQMAIKESFLKNL